MAYPYENARSSCHAHGSCDKAAKVAHWTAVPPLNQCPLTVLCHWSCSKSLTHLHARLDTAFLRAALIFLCKCMPRSSRVFVHISLHIHEMPRVSSMPSMKKLVTRVTGTVRGPATGYIAKVLIWDHQWYPVVSSGTRGTLEGQRLQAEPRTRHCTTSGVWCWFKAR